MKRQKQVQGVRKWFGGDLLQLQSEPLSVLDQYLGQYGSCVLSGCRVTANGSKWDIAPGLVVLSGKDPEGTAVRVIAPYSGATAQSLPLYLTLSCTTEQAVYQDGESKPTAYNYTAVATSVEPAFGIDYIEITDTGISRFSDVLQDSAHRFVSDQQVADWTAKETQLSAQNRANNAYANACRYTDTVASGLSDDIQGANTYSDTVVASLEKRIKGGVTEDLDTLEKIAAALGQNPEAFTALQAMIQARADSWLSNVTLTKLFSSKGYYEAPDGLSLQWGYATPNSSGSNTIYFLMSFTAVYAFIATPVYYSSATQVVVTNYISLNNSYVETTTRRCGGSCYDATNQFFWLAVGRWK